MVVVYFYTRSVPTNLLWWSLQLSSAALMTFGGIWACQRRELAPITFGLGLGLGGSGENGSGGSDGASHPNETGGPSQGNDTAGDDLEAGIPSLSRGRRGRNREEYEMVPMKEEGGHTA